MLSKRGALSRVIGLHVTNGKKTSTDVIGDQVVRSIDKPNYMRLHVYRHVSSIYSKNQFVLSSDVQCDLTQFGIEIAHQVTRVESLQLCDRHLSGCSDVAPSIVSHEKLGASLLSE